MCCVMGYTGHDLSAEKFKEYLLRTVDRGPDDQRVVEGPYGLMGFGRLAIMGLTPEGMQPFYRGADCVVCNGELYGFRFEKEILKRRGYKFCSDCDCEILLPLYYEYGLDMFRHMDAEFALILYDSRKDRLIAARDPIGIRPLFYGYSKSSHKIAFSSEMRNLIGWCDDIRPFPIGSYYCDGRFVRYEDIADVPAPMQDDMPTILQNIREKLIAGVEKRLDADAPVGFLLSGGLDSSLVCSIAAKKLGKPIRTFAIGMDTDAIDLKYARQTADYLGSEHHEIIINREMVLSSLEEVIRLLGTWDITTIRASMGMYLLCKAIHEQTDVRVLLTGEISDELFGYKYTDYAPTADAFQQESQKRIRELYMYDVLRADRCISAVLANALSQIICHIRNILHYLLRTFEHIVVDALQNKVLRTLIRMLNCHAERLIDMSVAKTDGIENFPFKVKRRQGLLTRRIIHAFIHNPELPCSKKRIPTQAICR